MAKGNMLLGQARGKLGSIVFSRSNGQQITRTRNTAPRNPRTEAQQLQRMVMATISSARGLLAPIVDHSFEGVAYGQPSLSEFSRRNMAQLRSVALADLANEAEKGNFAIKGSGIAPVNNYMMSKGSLFFPTQTFTRKPNSVYSTLVGVDIAGTGSANADALSSSWGVQPGDQLTLVTMWVNPIEIEQFGDAVVPQSYMRWYRWVIPTDVEMVSESITTVGDKIAPQYIDASRSVRAEELVIFPNTSSVAVTVSEETTSQLEIRGACLILSRQDSNGKWLRSTSYMQVGGDIFSTAKDAMPSFGSAGAENLGSDRILNNATTGSSVTTASDFAVKVANVQVNVINNSEVMSYNHAENNSASYNSADITLEFAPSQSPNGASSVTIVAPITDATKEYTVSGTSNAVTYNYTRAGGSLYIQVTGTTAEATGTFATLVVSADGVKPSHINLVQAG